MTLCYVVLCYDVMYAVCTGQTTIEFYENMVMREKLKCVLQC